MTISKDVVLWNNGRDRLCLLQVPVEQQYQYIDGTPCITFEVSYENRNYKGCDTFTLFDHFYISKISEIEKVYRSANGSFLALHTFLMLFRINRQVSKEVCRFLFCKNIDFSFFYATIKS